MTGDPISSPLTLEAIRDNKIVFADGVHTPYACSISESCPLNSVLVVPLHIDHETIGAIKLYESRNRVFHGLSRALGEGITSLLSNQLLLSRYEEHKNLLCMAELKLIQAQVNPHFLFNALNTIISIVRKDPGRARDLLMDLSSFFRKNLKRSSDMSTLEEELEHINAYLGIEKARFEDRLTVEMDIDPALMKLRVPTFTLQPLMENAIKHGISGMLEQGIARIHACRDGDKAVIHIEDNAGSFHDQGSGDGLGIKIVDTRIKSLMGQQYGTEVYCEPHRLTRVTVTIPAEGCAPS